MEKKIRIGLLKQGGKRALKEYCDLGRNRDRMNLGTRPHRDLRRKDPKHKLRVFSEG